MSHQSTQLFTLLWLFFSHLWPDPGIYHFSLVQTPSFHSILSPHHERGVSQVAEKYLLRIPDTKSFLDSGEGSSFTSPAHPVFLGLRHFSGPRILVFTMTFTEQLACPLESAQGLADSDGVAGLQQLANSVAH